MGLGVAGAGVAGAGSEAPGVAGVAACSGLCASPTSCVGALGVAAPPLPLFGVAGPAFLLDGAFEDFGVPTAGEAAVETSLDGLAVPFFEEECSERSCSICRAEVMKSCQIRAGKVPPSTGLLLKLVVIGISLFG